MNEGRPLILSASRRTDLPGFHAEECALRIRDRIRRLKTRVLAGVVFWSKHVDAFLGSGALRTLTAYELENPAINLTVTGLGSTKIEPGAPSAKYILSKLPDLIETFHSDPKRIRWRFDPIIKGASTIEMFIEIGRAMSSFGVPTCTFSFPAYRSLKGDLSKQFEEAGVSRWQDFEKREFLKELSNASSMLSISLKSCSQPENTTMADFIEPAQCIPFDVPAKGFPPEKLAALGKDRSQRTHCTCIESEDIGDYEKDPCFGGCVYCYSKACVSKIT